MGVSPMHFRNMGEDAHATGMQNPFNSQTDPDRHHIWQRLVQVDSEAFVAADWEMVEEDFAEDRFEGVRCSLSANPDDWKLAFATLASYRDNWLNAARE